MSTGFDQGALEALPSAPDFIQALRKEAFEAFNALPVPSQDTEEWRYTDLADFDFDLASFTPGGSATTLDEVPEEILAAAGVVGERAGLAIQCNSESLVSHLDPELVAAGVIFTDLDTAAAQHPDLVEPHLHTLVPAERTKFTALHAAFRTAGTFLYVPDGVVVELPLQTLTWLNADGAAVFPHTVIVTGRDSEVSFIDRYASPPLQRAFSDAVTEIHAGANARIRYVSIQDWGSGVTHLSVQRTELGRDAQFHGVGVGFGADLARSESESILVAPGAHSEMLGVFFGDGTQHYDHRTEQDHVAPNCTSDLLYKGALRDESKAVYSGWVHVRPGAQKTEAFQTCRNIVLSEHAKADAIPNLEIEANDVKCGHAASVGPVEEETLFYLMSRGIPHDEAERLIVSGFFQEVLDRISLDEVRDSVAAAIAGELDRGARSAVPA